MRGYDRRRTGEELHELDLPDGRRLRFAVSGPDNGRALLFHHGTPGSAYQLQHVVDAVHARGWRLVTLSRPGCPGSSRRPGRSVADVVPDTVAVLDALGVERLLVAGVSGGGPHALACAALMPGRVDAVLAICSLAPYGADGLDFLAGMGEANVKDFGLTIQGESALRPHLSEKLPSLRAATPAQTVESLSSVLPAVDRACLTAGLGAQLAASLASAASGTVDGWVDDALAFTRPWGFELEAIAVPVSLWHGSADLMVPFAHGRWLSRHLPDVRAHLEQGEGHLSINVGSIDRMMAELAELAPG